MKASQVLDHQADLLARLTMPMFAEYVRLVLSGGQDMYGLLPDGLAEQNSRTMVANLSKHARMGEAYKVSPDMSRMVVHAAALLDDSDTFAPDLAPSEFGFVHFEEPLPIVDVRGRTMLAHWLVWGKTLAGLRSKRGFTETTVPATSAYWFNDSHLQPDEVAQMILNRGAVADKERMGRVTGRWHMIGADIFHVGRPVGAPMGQVDNPEVQAAIEADGDTVTDFTNPLRYLHALWMLLGQSITTVRPEPLDRMTMKRAGRAGIPPRVTVIELRRAEGGRNNEPTAIEWSHRWLVRGHMRWQPYGSASAEHDHVLGPVEVEMSHSVRYCTVPGCDHHVKRIFIAPYVKGPEGKQLRFTDHVYALNR